MNSDRKVMQLSYYAPVYDNGCDQYGRVMYNEYHVDDASVSSGTVFPAERDNDPDADRAKSSAMSAQEMMLEYSLFDRMNFSVPTVAPPTIAITASPSTTFTGGQTDGSFTFAVTNGGAAPISTYPAVTMTVTLPAGLTAVTMTDPSGGWN